jgi:hypothetical protein
MDIACDFVEVDNRVSGPAPGKLAVNTAVRDAFTDVPGEWRIVVTEITHFSPPWWWVSVEGGGKLLEMSLRPCEQRAEVLRDRLMEAIRPRR